MNLQQTYKGVGFLPTPSIYVEKQNPQARGGN